MKFSNLISDIQYYNYKLKKDILVIIPVFTEYNVLFEHLKYLCLQSFQEFDVIIVLGYSAKVKTVLDFLHILKPTFGIVIAQRNTDSGAPGGFFTGQKYALENNYDYIVTAECDCFPEDPYVMEKLYAHRSYEYVGPHVFIMKDGKRFIRVKSTINHYSLIYTGIIKKYGLYFTNIYLGGEDSEYATRIKTPKIFIENYCTHPLSGKNIPRRLIRSFLYTVNSAAIEKRFQRFTYQFFNVIFSLVSGHFFVKRSCRPEYTGILKTLFLYDFNKLKFEERFDEFEYADSARCKDADVLNFDYILTPLSSVFDIFRKSVSHIRKEVIVEQTFELLPLYALSVFCKSVYIRSDEEKCIVFSTNPNIFLHVLIMALFILSVTLTLLFLYPVFILCKLVLYPKTFKFGIDSG